MRHALSARRPTGDPAQRWGIAVVAALPALLVALALPLVIEGSLSGFLYAPLVVLVFAATAGLGAWSGLVATVAGTVVGAIVGPGGQANASFLVGALLAGVLLSGTWIGQVLARGAHPLLCVLPALALVIGVFATGVTGTLESGVLAAFTSLAIVLLLLLLGPWNGDDAMRPARWAQVVSVGTILLVALVTYAVAINTGGLAGPSDRLVLFGSDDPGPKTEGGVPDPFLIAARWQLDPAEAQRALFALDLTERAPLNRPVWASFSTYNGIAWIEPPTYGVAGDDIPADKPSQPVRAYSAGTRLHVNAALPGQWVPVPQRVTQVLAGVATRVDPVTGVTTTVSSPVDQTFDVRYAVAIADEQALSEATASRRPGLDPTVALPGPLSGPMADLAQSIADRAGKKTWNRLTALAQELRGSRYQAAPPQALAAGPPDRSYVGLNRVLAEGVGFQEQYAAIFALVARSWGVPTRLAIGFVSEETSGGMTEVMAPQVSIWPEARLADIGWVAFQGSPQDEAAGRPAVVRPLRPGDVPEPARPDPSASASPGTADGSAGDAGDDREGPLTRANRAIPWAIVLPIVAVVALVTWLLLVAARRRRVRASLHAGDPRDVAAGAWTWMRLMLAEAWIPLPLTYGPAEDAPPPPDLPDAVAGAVQRLARESAPIRYSPAGATPMQAARTWELADDVARAVRQATGWRTGLRRRLVPLDRSRLAAPASGAAEVAVRSPGDH